MDLFNEIDYGAEFSNDRKHRYALWRIWDKSKPFVMFIGLNPSAANELEPDNTITRVIGFAKEWGYGGLYMLNCFPYVSTNPDDLIVNDDNSINDQWIKQIGAICDKVIFAWGAFSIVKEKGRDEELIKMFPEAYALVINKDGSPRHPLYVPLITKLVPYKLKNHV